MDSFCEWSMWPLCSSTRATPLKIMTTARRSVHTFIGSNEVFSTKTLPFILSVILREPQIGCQNYVAFCLTEPPKDTPNVPNLRAGQG